MKKTTKTLLVTALIASIALLTGCMEDGISYKSGNTGDTTTTTTNTTTTSSDTSSTPSSDDNRTSGENMPDIPTFTGLSQGRLVVNCGEEINFLVAYNCLKTDTSVRGTASNGILTEVDSYKTGNITVKEYTVTERDDNTSTVIEGYFSAGVVVDQLLGTETCLP